MIRMNAQSLARILTTTLTGLLAIGLEVSTAAPALGQAHGTWTFTGRMNIAREEHTATLLQNGHVLVAGGVCVFANQCDTPTTLASAELYNPSTGTWTETGSMSTPRQLHAATLLKNGEVLVTGGFTGNTILDSAELYNPSTGTWRTTSSMAVARGLHGAVLLRDGEVLVAGGDVSTTGERTAAAELYDPSTGSFTATGSMKDARASAQLVLLQNGKVLIAGSNEGNRDDASCTGELFSNSQWHLTSALADCVVFGDVSALLPNGDVLIDGGSSASEFYNPSTNVWQATLGRQFLDIPQHDPLALLATGKVLLAGLGANANHMFISKAALYNPSTNKWTLTGSMQAMRRGHTLTRLLNGKVLAAGGNRPVGEITLGSAELYTP